METRDVEQHGEFWQRLLRAVARRVGRPSRTVAEEVHLEYDPSGKACAGFTIQDGPPAKLVLHMGSVRFTDLLAQLFFGLLPDNRGKAHLPPEAVRELARIIQDHLFGLSVEPSTDLRKQMRSRLPHDLVCLVGRYVLRLEMAVGLALWLLRQGYRPEPPLTLETCQRLVDLHIAGRDLPPTIRTGILSLDFIDLILESSDVRPDDRHRWAILLLAQMLGVDLLVELASRDVEPSLGALIAIYVTAADIRETVSRLDDPDRGQAPGFVTMLALQEFIVGRLSPRSQSLYTALMKVRDEILSMLEASP